MDVAKVTDGRSTHYEPELDQTWSQFDKLRWLMGCVLVNTGLRTRLYQTSERNFCLNVVTANSVRAMSSRGYQEVWSMLVHMDMGAEIARETLTAGPGADSMLGQ